MEFPISYPWTHGAAAFLEEAEGDLSHERVADMCAAALELFQSQYRDKPRYEALACAAAAGAPGCRERVLAALHRALGRDRRRGPARRDRQRPRPTRGPGGSMTHTARSSARGC
ncbi:MAG: hypothetical protein SangKO_075790 [Sandaracinaceae bacterium]